MKDYSTKAKIDFLIENGVEVWLPIKGFETYSVSSEGRVRNNLTDLILKPQRCTSGYLYVVLCNKGTENRRLVHRLVLEAFKPEHAENEECDHVDRNRENNNIFNLRWVTHQVNCFNRG